MMISYLLIHTTCSTKKEAEKIARVLIERRLIACAQIHRVLSLYPWQGHLCRDNEYRLSIKTTTDKSCTVREVIAAHHSYQIPELIECPITGGSEAYLKWIQDQTA